MKKVELSKEFLEKQLEIWKKRESKKKKWIDNISKYKQTLENLKNNIQEINILFDKYEFAKNEIFRKMYQKSKDKSIELFDLFESKSIENDENIRIFFDEKYFNEHITNYNNNYIYESLIKSHKQYLEYLKKNHEKYREAYEHVDGKGAFILYLLIEFLSSEEKDIYRNLIKFYDLALRIFLVPHSMRNTRGLHYEICNNNFFMRIKEFFEIVSSADLSNNQWLGYLNAKWPYNRSEENIKKEFNLFNTSSTKELFGWINLGKKVNENYIAIYNEKIKIYLKILMNNTAELDDVYEFYEVFTKYLDDKKPYPNCELSDEDKILYADQFFQYVHELEIEEMNKNIIYYGAPGTGKTYHVTKQLIDLHDVKESSFKIVQFHPSYGYEDFIEGIKPKGLTKDGNIKFELVNGEFKQFCIDALRSPNDKFYFIVDEINRAELSRTFGELLYCFEYRVKFEDNGTIDYHNNKTNLIRTQYSSLIDNLENKNDLSLIIHEGKSYFGIPENIYFVGTMNDIDKSIDSFDMALRRRFTWIRKDCDLEIVKEWLYENKIDQEVSIKYIKACEYLNLYIEKDLILGKSYQIGHAYFMKLKLENESNNLKDEMLEELWAQNIKPLLNEYLRADYQDNEIEEKLKIAKEKFTLKDKDNQ